MSLISFSEPDRSKHLNDHYYNQTSIDGNSVYDSVGVGTTGKAKALITPTGIPYMYDSGDVTTGISTYKLYGDTNRAYTTNGGTRNSWPQEHVGFSICSVGGFKAFIGSPGYDQNRHSVNQRDCYLNSSTYHSPTLFSSQPEDRYQFNHYLHNFLWRRDPYWNNAGTCDFMVIHNTGGHHPSRNEYRQFGSEYDFTDTTIMHEYIYIQIYKFLNPLIAPGDPPPNNVSRTNCDDNYAGQRFGHSVAYSNGTFIVGAPGVSSKDSSGNLLVNAHVEGGVKGKLGIGGIGTSVNKYGVTSYYGPYPHDGRGLVEINFGMNWMLGDHYKFPYSNTTKYSDTYYDIYLDDYEAYNDSVKAYNCGQAAWKSYLTFNPTTTFLGDGDIDWGGESLFLRSSEHGDAFGWAVATKYGKILVGAPDANNGRGKVYMYRQGEPSSTYNFNNNYENYVGIIYPRWEPVLEKVIEPVGAAKSFGWSISIGSGRIAIGDLGGNDGKGSCYILDLNGCTVGILTAIDGEVGDEFGYSVSIKQGIVAVGAPSASVGIGTSTVRCGAVYGFNRDKVSQIHQTPIPGYFDSEGQPIIPTKIFKVIPNDGENNDRFGHSVCVASGRVFVGAPFKYNPDLNHLNDNVPYKDGAMYVHNLGGGFIQKTTGINTDSHYGWAIACDSHVVFVTAPFPKTEHLVPDLTTTDRNISNNAVANTYGTSGYIRYETQPYQFPVYGYDYGNFKTNQSPYNSSDQSLNISEGSGVDLLAGRQSSTESIFAYYTPSVVTLYDVIDQKY